MILDNLKYWFGLDHVTVLDEDHICTVTNFVNEYTGQQKYVYAVFERELYNEGGETWEKWRYHFEYYCVTRALSSKDFADVAVGDSMKKLLAIEPGIEMFYGKNKYDISLYIGSEFLLMLEDGLLYVQHMHSEDPIITELEFHPWGEPVTVFETEAFMAVAPNRPPLPSS